jgi:rhomboid family GlyGly-CTERM serine protease
MIFHPAAVCAGEWWRLFTHPFVHVTWYHLLLDASAFFLLYHGLLESRMPRRLLYVGGCGCGSLLLAWLVAPLISTAGLCGLSGIAHGLMAISAAELLTTHDRHSTEWRIGVFTLAIVVAKAACEAITGHILFGFLYFGMVGEPLAVCHAGGIVGGLTSFFLMRPRSIHEPCSTNLPLRLDRGEGCKGEVSKSVPAKSFPAARQSGLRNRWWPC